MTAPMTGPMTDDPHRAKVARNVDRMASQGASADEIEQYIQAEGIKPVAAAPSIPGVAAESTQARPRPKPSTLSPLAALAPVAQGLTLGAADEILGAVEGVNQAAHGGSFKKGYVEGRDKVRAGTKQFAEEHPVASPLLTVAGGIAPAVLGPGKALLKAGTPLLARLGLGAAEGAAYGGVSGALSADEDRGAGAIEGGLIGGVLGGGIPLVGAGVNAARNLVGRTGAAAGRHADALLMRALQRDQVNPRALMAPAGKPTILPDLAGENTLGLARGAQATPSEAKERLAQFLHVRHAEQPTRVLTDVETAAGRQNENVHDTAEQLIEQRRANANPLYEQAYAAPPITDAEVVNTIAKSKYLRQAYRLGREQAREEGIKLPALPGRGKPRTPTPEPTAAPAEVAAPDLTKRARTPSGRLYSNLRKASDAELANEYAALHNANAVENMAPTALDDVSGGGPKYVGKKKGAAHATGRVTQRQKSIAKIETELERRGIPPEDAMWMAGANAGDDTAAEVIEGSALSRPEPEGADVGFDFGKNVESPAPAIPKKRPFKGLPVQAIDYTKRGADALIERKYRGGSMDRNLARIIRNKVRTVLERTDEAVPEYKAARQQFAGDSELMDALESGSQFLKKDYRITRKELARMSEGEREMHAAGALDVVRQAIDKTPDGGDVVKRIFGTKAKRSQLRVLLGDEQYAALKEQMGVESRMVRTKDRVTGGSPTARIQPELAELADTPGMQIGEAVLRGNPKTAALRALLNKAKERGAGNVGQVANEVSKRMLLQPGTPQYQAWIRVLERMQQDAVKTSLPRTVARRALIAGVSNRE
jgi:hypothetical protein